VNTKPPQVKTADQQAKATAKDINEGISAIRAFLLALAGIALFVGAFVGRTLAKLLRELLVGRHHLHGRRCLIRHYRSLRPAT
jgi:hypothetical protein